VVLGIHVARVAVVYRIDLEATLGADIYAAIPHVQM
jgi:hypothetical protein